jgi:methyl-accepting chemotaxis protein
MLERAIENVTTAIMMVDRDFVVTYVNETTRALLSNNADEFRKLWPSFNERNIVGTCIDTFHKNPSYQRRLLSDPKNLPHRADIAVGPLKFSLTVSASFDAGGNYSGNILEWADVTKIREQEALNRNYEGQIDAIGKSQAVIEFKMDGTIVNANENFLKTLGYSLDEIKGRHHSMFVEDSYARSGDYRDFWRGWAGANIRQPNTSGSAKAAKKSGFRRLTIRFWISTASPSRLLNMPRILRNKSF